MGRHAVAAQAAGGDERLQAGAGRRRERPQAVVSEHAVLVQQGHDVRNGPQGHQGQRLHHEVAEGFAHAVALGHLLADGPDQLEGHADARQVAIAELLPGQLRVEHVGCGRQLLAGLVMVGDDHVQAQSAGVSHLLDGRDTAVDRHHHLGATVGELLERLAAEPVALLDTVGDVDVDVGAQVAQAPHQQRGGADAVGVVVAEDGDAPPRAHGVEQEIRRRGDLAVPAGVVQFVQGGLKEALGCGRLLQAAVEQQHRRHVGDVQGRGETAGLRAPVRRQYPLRGHDLTSIAMPPAQCHRGRLTLPPWPRTKD